MMAYTSYKKIDDVGRVVLPKDVREELGLRINDVIKIDVEKDKIIITKAEETCLFCGNKSGLIHFKGKTICGKCVKDLNNT